MIGADEATVGSPATAALPTEAPIAFAETVVAWQRVHGRHGLPWQCRDPYRVWLSEVMLQQTQVSVVLRYYQPFLDRFPSVSTLAAAPAADVLAQWSGLGYYGRARNLHRAAQTIVDALGGTFPTTAAGWTALPGIGRSTAAAIAAFCFDERAAILDGNVKRVLTRVHGIDADLAVATTERALWDLATAILPSATDMPRYTQGLMDIGATICTARQPACLLCPVVARCEARLQGRVDAIPRNSRRTRRSTRDTVWLWLWHGERFWLTSRPESGIWAGLMSLPEFDDDAALAVGSAAWPGTATRLPPFVHTLTHLDWTLRPVRWVLPADLPSDGRDAVTAGLAAGRWVTSAEASALGLPAPLRRLVVGGAPADSIA